MKSKVNIVLILAILFSFLQLNKLSAQTSCCRVPDSLKLTSITTNRFCVSWLVKDSFPCDSITASIIQFRKVGTTTWTAKTVNFPKGQKLINFCETTITDFNMLTKC